MRRSINTRGMLKFTGDDQVPFPRVALRKIANVVRNVKPIPGYRSICDIDNDNVFAIVSEDYKLIQHQEVIDAVELMIAPMVEYGKPERTIWLSPDGARKKAVWKFSEVPIEIRPNDFVSMTVEAYSSFDTSLAQVITVGGFRQICSNGMMVGKMLADYKRKHVASLDLDAARQTIAVGMQNYSKIANLWKSYTERLASKSEYTLFEELPFHKEEKERIFTEIKRIGAVKQWEVKDGVKVRDVAINAWDIYNVMTAEATHNVTDVARQVRILDGIANGFHAIKEAI